MKYLILFALLFSQFGCSSDSSQNEDVVDTQFEFSIQDADGNDLLNPENPESFDESEIKLFYLIDGQKKEVYDPNMTYSRNFFIFKHENDYRIRIFVNDSEHEDKPITYIQWNSEDTDTIQAEIKRSYSLVRKEKVWLNDVLIWSFSDNSTDAFHNLIK